MALPLTTFRGTLKQLDPSVDSDSEPARGNAFRWAFPAFLDPLVEDTSANQLSPHQKITPRRRRFSGGQFTRTTPKRYYTICLTANGFDAGTLCRELKAYAGSILRQKVDVQDDVDSPTSVNRKVINIHFYDPDGEIASRLVSGVGTALSLRLGSDGITFFGITLSYQTFDVVIENVIDLRLPATQEWFFETFRTGYGDFWHKPNGASVSSFAPMLGNLMFPDLGGTSVTDAIGYCLRSMGIAAFIYPSARSDAEIVVDRGIFQYARGFNLLDFRGTEINLKEAPTRFDDDGVWDGYKWPLTLEIAELSADRDIAERYRGSWRLPGIVKLHEQFFAGGGILGGREVGDWSDAEVDPAAGQLIKGLASKLKKADG
jgi:hypothetical protein